jgi:DNA-binding beta-propeller fold protein YncE
MIHRLLGRAGANWRTRIVTGLFAGVILALGLTARALDRVAQSGTVEAPRFEVDPAWPKPLPNGWQIGMAIGVGVDARDHVWIVHRRDTLAATEVGADQNPPTATCCKAAPPVLEFDTDGTLLRSWGGPGEGYEWPESNHGIFIDYKGIVWLGGNVGTDSQLLKFTPDGKFVAQFGHKGQSNGSNDTVNFGKPAKIFVDPKTNEAYIADGYGNKRVAVIDADTGVFKRYWGAYGNKPDDTPLPAYNPDAPPDQQFRNPVHCADLSVDNLVYVCDRPNDRLQVFTREGKFVKEVVIAKRTGGDGSIWDIAFSKDPQQKYIYIADGKNERIYVLVRDTLEVLTTFGDGGRQPGQFFAVHSIATDSKGNIFTTETYEGRRLQKFVYKGIGQVPRDQGVVWPKK